MFSSCFLLSDIKHVFVMFFILTSMFFTTMATRIGLTDRSVCGVSETKYTQ